SVTTADLNGDGRIDIVTTNTSDNTVTVFLNQGSGTFLGSNPAYNSTVSQPISVVARDMNNDGRIDLVVASWYSDNVAVLLNQGAGVFPTTNPTISVAHAYQIDVGDLNGDGLMDIASSGGYVLNQGSMAFSTQTGFGMTSDCLGFRIGDLNGDAKPDVLCANYSGGTVSVAINRGNGTFYNTTQSYPANASPYPCAMADVNLDGLLDAVVPNPDANTCTVLLNTGYVPCP
ncbi:MAG: VCBS repeat-containing protein, partial [Deltaproteobacteria bacterium]